MNRPMVLPVKILAGLFIVALSALPQYTISARPGVINSVEGTAYVNGVHVNDVKAAQRMFLNANDAVSTDVGKVEVLLTPGVYLRMGDHSEVRMISPSLTDTQIKVVKGEAMIEAMDLLKENSIRVQVGDSTTQIEKMGLYRFSANNPGTVSIFEGKASVEMGDRKTELGKDHMVAVDSDLKVQKFKAKDNQDDDLYAWSKTRDEYDSASSYHASKSLASNTLSGGAWSGYGFSGFNGYAGPGWFYNPVFSSYAWLPGDGAFYSPFGYGFYAPGFVNYAPVVYSSLGGVRTAGGGGVAVPFNPGHPPATVTKSALSSGQQASFAAAQRSARVITSGVGAGGGHISSNSLARSASGIGGGSQGGYRGSGAASGFSGHAMAMSGSAAHSGGAPAGGAHR